MIVKNAIMRTTTNVQSAIISVKKNVINVLIATTIFIMSVNALTVTKNAIKIVRYAIIVTTSLIITVGNLNLERPLGRFSYTHNTKLGARTVTCRNDYKWCSHVAV